MFHKKSLYQIAALVVIAVMALTACVATPPAAPAESGSTDAAPAAAGEQITLRWANIMNAEAQEQWQPLVDAFEAEHPNIDIVMESTAGSGAAVYPDVLKTSMASGSPPDLFFMWGGSIAQPFIDAEQTLDLTAYYEQYGWNEKFAPWVIDRITSR